MGAWEQTYNFSLMPLVPETEELVSDIASTVTSRVHGPSWVSSTLKVWRALAGIWMGCGELGETVISLPSRVKRKRLHLISPRC